MTTRMEQGTTDTSVTELLNGVDFHNVKNRNYCRNGVVKNGYKNGYNKVGNCRFYYRK